MDRLEKSPKEVVSPELQKVNHHIHFNLIALSIVQSNNQSKILTITGSSSFNLNDVTYLLDGTQKPKIQKSKNPYVRGNRYNY